MELKNRNFFRNLPEGLPEASGSFFLNTWIIDKLGSPWSIMKSSAGTSTSSASLRLKRGDFFNFYWFFHFVPFSSYRTLYIYTFLESPRPKECFCIKSLWEKINYSHTFHRKNHCMACSMSKNAKFYVHYQHQTEISEIFLGFVWKLIMLKEQNIAFCSTVSLF